METFFFREPRATPDARFGLGAAFLRAVRLIFLRSALSVIDFVFILFECSILLDSCVLFHQLLQTVAGKAYRELSILAISFATQDGSAAAYLGWRIMAPAQTGSLSRTRLRRWTAVCGISGWGAVGWWWGERETLVAGGWWLVALDAAAACLAR